MGVVLADAAPILQDLARGSVDFRRCWVEFEFCFKAMKHFQKSFSDGSVVLEKSHSECGDFREVRCDFRRMHKEFSVDDIGSGDIAQARSDIGARRFLLGEVDSFFVGRNDAFRFDGEAVVAFLD